jgi:hypothetical protein
MTTLTLDTAESAIFTQLKTAWDANTPALNGGLIPQTVYESSEPALKPHPKDSKAPWARAVIRHSGADEKVTLVGGTGARYRRYGCVWVQVFTPDNDATSMTLCQKLAMVARTAFEGKRTAADNGVHFTKASIKDCPKDGPWFFYNVAAYFYWDEIR